MKKNTLLRFLALTIGLLSAGQTVFGQSDKYRTLNVGLKVGLNAMSLSHYRAYQGEVELDNLSWKNKSGFNCNLFFRINLDRLFMQPEAEWSLYEQELSYSLPEENDYSPTLLSIKTQVAKVNVLVGYNMIKTGPFLLNFVIGPSFRDQFISHYDRTVVVNSGLQNKKSYYSTNGITGITINIAKVHFDVRYEVSLFNSNISFDEIRDRPESLAGISIHKKENILSFSCGWMF